MQVITLNIVPDGTCEVVHANQYDIGRAFIIRFRDDGANAVINNPTVKINGRKTDQHVFLYTESDKYDASHYIITKSGSGTTFQVTIKTSEQMTAAVGDVLCQLTLEQNDSVIGTLNFIIHVQEQPYATGDPSETELPSIIAEATEQMEAAAASAQQAEDAVEHYPYINSTNKNWMVYNAIQGEFVDTGVRAQGIDGSGAVQTVNNVLPDANGNVDVKWSDMSSVSNLAITEETRTMTAQRVEGSYVFVKADDQLYEVTTTIDANGTLTPGTNATARSVGYVLAQLNSDLVDLNYSGKTLSFSESVICPAYVSASGNYVSFVVPLNVVASKTYAVTVSDISFFKPTGGRLTWSSDFDQTYKDVKKLAAGGLKIELKFSSTQSAFVQFPAVVTFSGSITVS